MTKGTRSTEKFQVPIDRVKQGAIEVPGVAKIDPSNVLGMLIRTATAALAIAYDKMGKAAEAIYGAINFDGQGQRVQYFDAPSQKTALLAGKAGILAAIAAIQGLIGDLVEACVRLLDQMTGSAIGSMFFTSINDGYVFETGAIDRRTNAVTNLLALGFTQVVYVAALGGFIGLRADDTQNSNDRRLYFLPLGKAESSGWAFANWTVSNALATALRLVPWRINAANLDSVFVRTETGCEYVNLREIAQGRVTSVADQAMAQAGLCVLGTTVDERETVIADSAGRTHFVPATTHRAAATRVAQPTA